MGKRRESIDLKLVHLFHKPTCFYGRLGWRVCLLVLGGKERECCKVSNAMFSVGVQYLGRKDKRQMELGRRRKVENSRMFWALRTESYSDLEAHNCHLSTQLVKIGS